MITYHRKWLNKRQDEPEYNVFDDNTKFGSVARDHARKVWYAFPLMTKRVWPAAFGSRQLAAEYLLESQEQFRSELPEIS